MNDRKDPPYLAAGAARHRAQPAQALLLLIVIAAATGTLLLGLVTHGVTSQPYAQTKAATDEPDVVANSLTTCGVPKQEHLS
jgi:hypothetical protein